MPIEGTRRRETDGRTGRYPPRSLAERASAIEPAVEDSRWADHEFVRGYGAMVLPFSGGDLLALRVTPRNSFGPYVSVWHRSPAGDWSIFVDGPALETACPRYWGPVAERAEFASIDLAWTGPSDLRVEVDEPRLEWTMSMSATLRNRAVFAVESLLPLRSWKPDVLVRAREWFVSRFLDLGDVQFGFETPSGHDTVIVPEAEYVIRESTAVLDGRSLGDPTRLDENPTIGDVRLPSRPSFVFARAHMEVTDPAEYAETRERVRDETDVGSGT